MSHSDAIPDVKARISHSGAKTTHGGVKSYDCDAEYDDLMQGYEPQGATAHVNAKMSHGRSEATHGGVKSYGGDRGFEFGVRKR